MGQGPPLRASMGLGDGMYVHPAPPWGSYGSSPTDFSPPQRGAGGAHGVGTPPRGGGFSPSAPPERPPDPQVTRGDVWGRPPSVGQGGGEGRGKGRGGEGRKGPDPKPCPTHLSPHPRHTPLCPMVASWGSRLTWGVPHSAGGTPETYRFTCGAPYSSGSPQRPID